jgi:hypothetical protein
MLRQRGDLRIQRRLTGDGARPFRRRSGVQARELAGPTLPGNSSRRLPLGQPRLDSAEARTKTVPDETADAGDGRDRQGDERARCRRPSTHNSTRSRLRRVKLREHDGGHAHPFGVVVQRHGCTRGD